jgi:hypothetical protein
MIGRVWSRLTVAAATVAAIALLAIVPAAQASSTSYTGTTSDGGSWVADVPSPWNGTLLLYSHGFGPPLAADAPDPNTKQALLNMGYALAGSSYDPAGPWWALGSAVRDQFETLGAVRADLPAAPRHVIAVGTSMGGLISALEDESSNGRLDGALTTCGIVGGGLELGNYQLDGEYAISKLLAPNVPITLVRFTGGPVQGSATGQQLDAIAQQAQTTVQGRARLALAMAFMNVATWAPGEAMPPRHDYTLQGKSSTTSSSRSHRVVIHRSAPWTSSSSGGPTSNRPPAAIRRGQRGSTSLGCWTARLTRPR